MKKKQTIVSILDDPLKQRIIDRALNIEGLQKLYMCICIFVYHQDHLVCMISRITSLHFIFFHYSSLLPGESLLEHQNDNPLDLMIYQCPSITTY